MPDQEPDPKYTFNSINTLEGRDNIYSGNEARTKLSEGFRKGVDAVKVSFGASGSNAIIEEAVYPFSRTTNDGKAILQPIKLIDPVENIGLNILKEVSDKQDHESGDGRKTAILLAGAILAEGMKAQGNAMEIKKSLDECLPIVLKSIDSQTKKITVEEVAKVATIASESESLGKLFQEIYQKIGSDGVIEFDNSNTPHTSYEITEGVRLLNCGFTFPYMANEDKGRKAVYKYPKILITKQKISNLTEIDPIIKALVNSGRDELVIFTEDIDLTVSQALAYLQLQGVEKNEKLVKFNTLVIKAPILWKDWIYEDFAKITGATIVNPGEGRTLKSFSLSWLGTCDKIVTSKDETVVIGSLPITEHLEKLMELGTDDSKLRVSRLKTKTAILKLGANSETELSYLKGKALDGRNASFLALNSGVVDGAGKTLFKIANELSEIGSIGSEILFGALQRPYRQLCENVEGTTENVKKYDFKDIFDPASVVKSAITNALSVASTILTTKVVIVKAK